MRCPYCSTIDTKVIDSRINQTADITRRRRECPRCQGRFTTYERVEEVMPLVIKKDGRRETFDREKVLSGIRKSCQKRPVTTQAMEECVGRIEKRLQSYGLKEVPSKTVGQMVMAELHQLDKVAYVRFASVYREFRDVEEFVADLQEHDLTQNDSTSSHQEPLFAFVEPVPAAPQSQGPGPRAACDP
jgi:transcriptional repressor NrdR